MVPPEEIEPVLQTITNNFVNEHNSSAAMAVGLNAIREICARCPLACSEDLLDYLLTFKTYKDKNVMMSTRSLIQLFREKNPNMLHKKNRGKPTEAMKEVEVLQYGETGAKDYIPGAEVLKDTATLEEEREDQEGWESEEEEWKSVPPLWISELGSWIFRYV